MTNLSPYSIRFTPEQRAFIRQQAAAARISEATWIKYILFSDEALLEKKQKRLLSRAGQADLSQVLFLLGQSRIPNNLNQLTKRANTGTLIIGLEAEKQINDTYLMVQWIRRTVIEELGLKA